MNLFENHIDQQFYLVFPSGIYLFKINDKNKKALCKICQKLGREAPHEMGETKFLNVLIFYYFHFCPLI